MFDVYYAGPQDFDPCNMAYVQLQHEKIAELVGQAYDYIVEHYGWSVAVEDVESTLRMFDIDYALLDKDLALRFDDFDVY